MYVFGNRKFRLCKRIHEWFNAIGIFHHHQNERWFVSFFQNKWNTSRLSCAEIWINKRYFICNIVYLIVIMIYCNLIWPKKWKFVIIIIILFIFTYYKYTNIYVWFSIINDQYNYNKKINIQFLPDGEKAVNFACCDNFIISLGASGRVFRSYPTEELSLLSLMNSKASKLLTYLVCLTIV